MTNDLLTRHAFGATLLAPNRTRFEIWAPDCDTVTLEIIGEASVRMSRSGQGWFDVEYPCGAGTKYQFRVSPDLAVPDPASRQQAQDVHDHSVVVDPGSYVWQTADWQGRPWHETVIYELHVGAMGGFAGVMAELAHLVELGVTMIELMPIADFPGPHNWGYDGVLPYAPDTEYGTPDELKALIDTAHGLGIMIMLDVVYNHFGPNGNYLNAYASGFYRHDRTTPWGDAIDFRRPEVRQFFIQNAIQWVVEYRIDGLRFDAVHAIGDNDFLLNMAADIRTAAGPGRQVHLVLENENQETELLRGPGRDQGYDAQWADDLHHCIHVLLTGERESYYEAFADDPAGLLARCLSEGFAFPASGRPADPVTVPMTAYVICLQNHDQIGNRAFGERLDHLADPQALQAATALLLLAPQIPLLFMGQEWATTAPFLYFASHDEELAEAVRTGRQAEFAGFAAFADPDNRERIPDPNEAGTFQASAPDRTELSVREHAACLALHRRLLRIRHAEIMPRLAGVHPLGAEVLGPCAVRARWRMGDGATLAIAVNFAPTAIACPIPSGRMLFASRPRDNAVMLEGYSAEISLDPAGDARP